MALTHRAGQLGSAMEAATRKAELDRGHDDIGFALARGKIADILQARGDLDGALHIRQHDELPVYERLGDVREKAVTLAKIGLIRLQQADATSHSDATELLAQAYRDFARMGLPEAETVRRFAELHGLVLDVTDPT